MVLAGDGTDRSVGERMSLFVAGAGARSARAARASAVGVAAAAHFDCLVVDNVVLGRKRSRSVFC